MDHINVTLELDGCQTDVRIPNRMEVSRLLHELDAIFNHREKREKYQFRIRNKGLILDEGKILSDYPVTSGDILVVEEKKT